MAPFNNKQTLGSHRVHTSSSSVDREFHLDQVEMIRDGSRYRHFHREIISGIAHLTSMWHIANTDSDSNLWKNLC